MSDMELPKKLTKRDLELHDFSNLQRQPDYNEDIAFTPALFSQVSLPYQDPKNQEIWTRRNGDVTLKVTPRTVQNEDGSTERRYPFGVTPRLLIVYLTTEAARTGSRTVELGGSMSALMRSLGMKHTGPNGKRLREHMERFFGASITFEGKTTNAAGSGLRQVYFQFADSMTLWEPAKGQAGDIVHRAPWQNEVRLSEQFFDEIANRNVPLDMNALRALGSSALKIDLYLWLAHRMSWLREDSYIKWSDLQSQFGAQFKEERQFKWHFLEALADVKKVYPGLNVDEAKGCLVLKPSRTPITKTRSTPKFGEQKAIGQ